MPDFVTQLHDEIDAEEEIRNRAELLARSTIKAKLAAALRMTPDITEALTIIAHIVEDDLAALTTEAFQAGVAHAQARTRIA